MADDEKWGLSREEINKRVREMNQEKKAKGPTRGGRSSGQGVKLLYPCAFWDTTKSSKTLRQRFGKLSI